MNTNIFLTQTLAYNNYDFTEQDAKAFLTKIFNIKDNCLYDSYEFGIDYATLIYIDIMFQENEEISILVKQIKQCIAKNWLKKKQLLNRLNVYHNYDNGKKGS